MKKPVIKCIMCGSQATHTAIAMYKEGLEKEPLCAPCKFTDESIRKRRGGKQYTE